MAMTFFVRWICHVYTHNHALIIRVRVVGQAGTHQLVMSTDQHMDVYTLSPIWLKVNLLFPHKTIYMVAEQS